MSNDKTFVVVSRKYTKKPLNEANTQVHCDVLRIIKKSTIHTHILAILSLEQIFVITLPF